MNTKKTIENLRELNEETKKEIERSLDEIKKGRYKTHEELGREMGF
ncbi:MAG: hypothetical protein ACE5G7_06150 [Candidatus Hydrothermarchaeaceae archaeon]